MHPEPESISPTLDRFRELAKSRRVIPVSRRLLVDEVTPVGLYKVFGHGHPGSFLFESAEQGRSWSRYSFVGVEAAAILTARHEAGIWTGRKPAGLRGSGPFLELLAEALDFLHTPRDESLPPFTGGLVGYLGFDVIRHVESLPRPRKHRHFVPDAVFSLVTDLAVLDHHDAYVTVIANAINYDGTDDGVDQAWRDSVQRVDQMTSRLLSPARNEARQNRVGSLSQAPSVTRKTSSPKFQERVKQAKSFIARGDAFQIVVSQRFELPSPSESLDVYRALRSTNPSPYLYFLQVPDGDSGRTLFDIAGASPEALLTIKNSSLKMHPIAGTRPRGVDPAIDEQLEKDLLVDQKERAEHLMLVDLGRNDLSRVCIPGSVKVDQFMQVEKYSHVMHLVSTVTGQQAPGVSALDAVLATFPAGTLSGAPKIRAIEIIDELEDQPRGVYGGAVGYFDFAGNADMAIAIRTALVFADKAIVQAGAGVVADSSPEHEDQECSDKAQVVIAAIERAHAMSQHLAVKNR